MRRNRLGLGGVLAIIVALIGCGSSGGSGTGTGGGGGKATGGTGGAGASKGTGGTTGGGFSTSVPGSTPLGGLSSGQATTLCNDIDAYFKTRIAPDFCKEQALIGALTVQLTNSSASDADLQAACTSAYTACLTGDGGITGGAACNPAQVMGEPATCKATVGDLSTCLNDDGTASDQAVSALPSCATLTAAQLTAALGGDAGAPNATDPASCASLDAMGCGGVSAMTGN
ncbi:MAG TPA: hypothetical protein VHO06_23480 [Polyangia bacterium]|nr:hypothetical protein [Polyangia bacterium]